ncbi:hypothetical protein ACTMU2_41295 [Cupriavidus basilensis]
MTHSMPTLHRAAAALGVCCESGLSEDAGAASRQRPACRCSSARRAGAGADQRGKEPCMPTRKILALAASDMRQELAEQRVAKTGTVRIGAIPLPRCLRCCRRCWPSSS